MHAFNDNFTSPTDDKSSHTRSITSSIAPSIATIHTFPAHKPSAAQPPSYTQSSQEQASPNYKDDELMTVKIPAADLVDSEDEAAHPPKTTAQPRRKSFLSKLGVKSGPPDKSVIMTRGDYLRYWARDKQGNYIGSEPEGAGRRLLRQRQVDMKKLGSDGSVTFVPIMMQ